MCVCGGGGGGGGEGGRLSHGCTSSICVGVPGFLCVFQQCEFPGVGGSLLTVCVCVCLVYCIVFILPPRTFLATQWGQVCVGFL